MTTDERREINRAWHDKRRARGVCGRCAVEVTLVNRRTGRPYVHCLSCRKWFAEHRTTRRRGVFFTVVEDQSHD